MNILILGGTTEARLLCIALSSDPAYHIMFSFAGITRSASSLPTPSRRGGFGGIDGLVSYLQESRTQVVIDATHPFAAQMSTHAVLASHACHLPLLRLVRPPWTPLPEDCWTSVQSIQDVPEALGNEKRRVFLTTGRKDITPFADTPHDYLLRSIDPPSSPLPDNMKLIMGRGPFTLDAELSLLRREQIDCLVTKNAGAEATAPKLEAARALNIPVIMIDRPVLPRTTEVNDIPAALDWLQETRRRV